MKYILAASALLLSSCATIEQDCTILNGCEFSNGNILKIYPNCDVDNLANNQITLFLSNPEPQKLTDIVIQCIKIEVQYKFKTDISSVW